MMDRGGNQIWKQAEDFCAEKGLEIWLTAGQASWQLGIGERAGGIIKQIVQKVAIDKEKQLQEGAVSVEDIVQTATAQRNKWPGDASVGGKSPEELWFSRASPVLPSADLMNPAQLSAVLRNMNNESEKVSWRQRLVSDCITQINKQRVTKAVIEAQLKSIKPARRTRHQ